MADTVRGNKASSLRTKVPRPNRGDLWAYTSPVPASFASLSKDRERKSESESFSEQRARSASCTPSSGPTSIRTRQTLQSKQNWTQALKVEQRNLEQIQNAFMYKIRTLAEQGRKLPGTYKFVVMVCNDNRELVEDSAEDSARNENEKRLIDELAERDETISELKKKLLKCEELASQQALQLAESQNNEFENQALKAENSSVKHICNRLRSRLEETDLKLKDATKQVERHVHTICMSS
ncbi:uncharacterized protein LOC110178280 isoform X2 [Drosophila serrata]|uniref:uncharacterized protein LOC110178280 isoform X2 n=1 Tax=Drosophila serrata TaxID=7274 RepID=UPI000A1CF6F2|nr:uncharacterized protein LOC110178280 isoform X2 [Drosophila serrata]